MGKVAHTAPMDMAQALNIAIQDYRKTKDGLDFSELFLVSRSEREFELRNSEHHVAYFSLQQLPGCCGVLVSYYSEINNDYRDKGYGKALANIRARAARLLKYGMMLATVVSTNIAEIKLLQQLGWLERNEFRNPKTGNIIKVFTLNI